jgi:hypothetical protein
VNDDARTGRKRETPATVGDNGRKDHGTSEDDVPNRLSDNLRATGEERDLLAEVAQAVSGCFEDARDRGEDEVD